MRRDSKPTAELLAAYVDGVTELTADERRRVEAHLAAVPAARDDETATRALLGQLRELGPAGNDPDWNALERSIGDAVGSTVPRSWWRGWRWVVPGVVFAATTAIIVLVMQRPVPELAPPIAIPDVVVPGAPASIDERVALYIDGADIEVELAADELIDDPFEGLYDPDLVEGFLTPSDLAWVDDLDDESLTRAEGWLARPRQRGKG